MDDPPQTPVSSRARRWKRPTVALLMLLLLAGGWALFSRKHPAPAEAEVSVPERLADVDVPNREQQQRQQVLGTWEDFYEGHRFLTIRDDGTALMAVELSGLASKLFAPRLEFDITWTFQQGKVTMLTTGGRPPSKAGLVLRMYGDKAEYLLEDLNETRLVLRDVSTQKQFEWLRLGTPEALARAAENGIAPPAKQPESSATGSQPVAPASPR